MTLPEMETRYSIAETITTNSVSNQEAHLLILNEGPIKVVSMSVFHKAHAFYPSDGKYSMTFVEGNQLHPAILFKSELPVGYDYAINWFLDVCSG